MRKAAILVAAVMIPTAALAHVGPTHGGLGAGLAHPLAGLDHILAMILAGLIAATGAGRRRWLLPAASAAALVAGGAAGLAGWMAPPPEPAIAATVIVLGAIVALRASPAVLGPLLVVLFSAAHGLVHAAGMPAGAAPLAYGTGFVAASLLLQAAGIALSGFVSRGRIARWIGAAALLAGGVLLMGAA